MREREREGREERERERKRGRGRGGAPLLARSQPEIVSKFHKGLRRARDCRQFGLPPGVVWLCPLASQAESGAPIWLASGGGPSAASRGTGFSQNERERERERESEGQSDPARGRMRARAIRPRGHPRQVGPSQRRERRRRVGQQERRASRHGGRNSACMVRGPSPLTSCGRSSP